MYIVLQERINLALLESPQVSKGLIMALLKGDEY